MSFVLEPDPVPLRTDEYGVLRVGESQVVLDLVIQEFEDGAWPEDIARGYPTLRLADVYAVIAYYLRHREVVDEYLRGRQEEAEKLRREVEAGRPAGPELRAKLLARKAQVEQGHAAPGK